MEGQDSGPFVHWKDYYYSDEEPQVKFGLREIEECVGGARKGSLPSAAGWGVAGIVFQTIRSVESE